MEELHSLSKLEEAISSKLSNLAFSPKILKCDHLCYIVKSDESYKNWLKKVKEIGSTIREFDGSKMNLTGKNFLIIRLSKPIKFLNYLVDILEIKQSDFPDFNEDWQHAEFIPECSLEEIVDKNPLIPFETSRLNDTTNKEIGVRFTKHYGLKFRLDSIADQ